MAINPHFAYWLDISWDLDWKRCIPLRPASKLMRIFKLASVAFKYLGVAVFGSMFVYWIYMSITKDGVAERGGFFFSLVPLGLAILSYYLFGALAKWAENKSGD